MAKIKLNLESTDDLSFLREVAIPTPTGTPLKIGFRFKHRTREQMADLAEKHAKLAGEYAEQAKDDTSEKPLRDYITSAIKRDVLTVMELATDWEVDGLEFNSHNLGRFFALYSGAARAISEDYRISMMEGRLGN